MKKIQNLVTITLAFSIVLSISSCYNKTNKVLLPNPYTIDNIKTAFLEYINFRLWYYPVEYSDRQPSDFYFDDYSGQKITAEIRIYSNFPVSEQSEEDPIICISTNITQQLAVFSHQGDNVYCLGLTSNDNYTYTVGKNYTVIKQYQFVIPEVRLPDFGTSEQKNNMIQIAAEAVTTDCCLSRHRVSLGYRICLSGSCRL